MLIMEKVLQEIKPAVVDTSKLVVSIAAGIKIQNIQQNLQSESKVHPRQKRYSHLPLYDMK